MAEHENFRSMDALAPIVDIVNEASEALEDKSRTIANSAIPDVLAAALGAGVGGVASFTALYGLGVVGLSAAGLTSGLATAGALVGGGMVAGVFVLAAPVAVLAVGGVLIAGAIKGNQLQQEKERLLQAAVEKHHAILEALKDEVTATKKRVDYLNSLNIVLQRVIHDLRDDLGEAA